MKTYHRRKFLAGLGLGAASPLLPSISKLLVNEAFGQQPRKRLILFVDSNGFLEQFSKPTIRTATDFDLGPVYQSLAPFKNRMTVMHRFFNPHSPDTHGNQTSTLTVMPSADPKAPHFRGPAGGPSIDRYIAKKIGTGDAFSSTAVGRGITVSADGPNQPFPLISSPSKAFGTYFGGALPTGGGSTGGFVNDFVSKDKSILDFLRADTTRLNARLAAPERAKLDQYLESLRSLEKQFATRAMAQTTCMKPATPMDGGLDVNLTQLLDLTFVAHRCNLTHVTYFSFEGMEGPHIVYNWLQDPRNIHDDQHAGDIPILQRIATWKMSIIARMADALSKAPEGNGTMLDSSLLAYVNTGGGSHHRGTEKHPMFILGGTPTGGRALDFPAGAHCVSEVYASIANMMGVPTDKFGDPKYCPGPLAIS
jgi:Protein of unknown function (DUF1552)